MSWPSLETRPPVDLAHIGDLKPLEVLYEIVKKTQQTPDKELKLARNRLKELQHG